MITIKHPIPFPTTYPLERIAPLKELLFFDIETTGFSGDTSQLYLIGCTWFDGFGWKMIQWFADSEQAERELLDAFFSFMKSFSVLIHFNGDRFDIPYLLKCCARLGLSHSFDGIRSLDIYRMIRPYQKLLGLESMKQKAIEQFLGIRREDQYSGGELIPMYRDYLRTKNEQLYRLLILHNEDDLKGMPLILPILNYSDMLSAPFTLKESRLFSEPEGSRLWLSWESPFSIPIPLEYELAPCSLELHDNELSGTVSLFSGELKYFYPDYKDYYYLPLEDMAIHKSVGCYVEPSARKRATARTCYTKKEGLFLPLFGSAWEPSFREDYRSSFCYTEYQASLLDDPNRAADYARQLLLFAGGR